MLGMWANMAMQAAQLQRTLWLCMMGGATGGAASKKVGPAAQTTARLAQLNNALPKKVLANTPRVSRRSSLDKRPAHANATIAHPPISKFGTVKLRVSKAQISRAQVSKVQASKAPVSHAQVSKAKISKPRTFKPRRKR
jgi:hypothetical protein